MKFENLDQESKSKLIKKIKIGRISDYELARLFHISVEEIREIRKELKKSYKVRSNKKIRGGNLTKNELFENILNIIFKILPTVVSIIALVFTVNFNSFLKSFNEIETSLKQNTSKTLYEIELKMREFESDFEKEKVGYYFLQGNGEETKWELPGDFQVDIKLMSGGIKNVFIYNHGVKFDEEEQELVSFDEMITLFNSSKSIVEPGNTKKFVLNQNNLENYAIQHQTGAFIEKIDRNDIQIGIGYQGELSIIGSFVFYLSVLTENRELDTFSVVIPFEDMHFKFEEIDLGKIVDKDAALIQEASKISKQIKFLEKEFKYYDIESAKVQLERSKPIEAYQVVAGENYNRSGYYFTMEQEIFIKQLEIQKRLEEILM